jgi:tyrosyl-tRNA synthetase
MGKSLGNYIGVGEPAQVQFDKTMSIPDELMPEWFTLLTDHSADDIARLTSPPTHPMEAKKTLAADIVTFYYGKEAAASARTEWERRFSGKQDPTEIPELQLSVASLTDGRMRADKLLMATRLANSGNEARRLIQQGGVTIGPNREKISDQNAMIAVTDGLIVRVGSRRIVRIRIC